VIDELLAENALFRLRAAQGVLGLADKHNPERLEAACAKAIAAGDPSYRTIKGILTAGTEATLTRRPAGDAGASAHLHGPAQLFADLVSDPSATVGSDVGATVIPLPIATGTDDMNPPIEAPAAAHPSSTVAALTSNEDAS
jgi:hypothetical protein